MAFRRTPEFDRWFGNSRVVDDRGHPLVVFHGTQRPWIVTFDPTFEGSGIVGGQVKWGAFWFASSKDNASYFGERLPKRKADEETIYAYGDGDRWFADIADLNGKSIFQVGAYPTSEAAEEAMVLEADLYNKYIRKDTSVIPVFLSIQNPLLLNEVIPREAEFKFAKENNHDGIIATDVYDGHGWGDVFVAFSPLQIKSAIENRGTYDPESDNIFD